MNNTLVMLKFSSTSVLPLNSGSDSVTSPSQSCLGRKILNIFMHSCIRKGKGYISIHTAYFLFNKQVPNFDTSQYPFSDQNILTKFLCAFES